MMSRGSKGKEIDGVIDRGAARLDKLLLRGIMLKLFLGLCVASGLAFPAMAQQTAPLQGPHCDAFTKNADGEWVAKQDMTILGPFGPVKIKAGQPVDEEMQDRLDDLCK
jgi:hypothetical protein